MSTLQEKFQQAVAYVTKGPPMQLSDNSQRLAFYAYFKQATEGQCKGKRPGLLDLLGRHKWDAWNKLGKMDKETAMKNYIAHLEKFVKDWQKWSGLKAAVAEMNKAQSKL
eukprot:TRINITY_DN6276_c0_g1_i1.p2 TRINITY_DN6276_c0_g1~~TRINITY_DN6276_c0_g1_i1.p2  ORF type:complete len:110 (+),score=31.66 TRINITY_DN6276_c0_g1_i1:112-441(+)